MQVNLLFSARDFHYLCKNAFYQKCGIVMLIDQLYSTERFETESGSVKASVRINYAHDVFKGHFPGTPVLPGVCTMLIIRELVERYLGCNLKYGKVSSCKFLAMVTPSLSDVVELEIDVDGRTVKAVGMCGGRTCVKMKAEMDEL